MESAVGPDSEVVNDNVELDGRAVVADVDCLRKSERFTRWKVKLKKLTDKQGFQGPGGKGQIPPKLEKDPPS